MDEHDERMALSGRIQRLEIERIRAECARLKEWNDAQASKIRVLTESLRELYRERAAMRSSLRKLLVGDSLRKLPSPERDETEDSPT